MALKPKTIHKFKTQCYILFSDEKWKKKHTKTVKSGAKDEKCMDLLCAMWHSVDPNCVCAVVWLGGSEWAREMESKERQKDQNAYEKPNK